MRLLLDEHYSNEIEERLRALGHDAIGVTERSDLRGRSDEEILERAAAEQRVIVTEDVGDFMPLVHRAAGEGRRHSGVVFTSPRGMPRVPATIGVFVHSLAHLVEVHPAHDALCDRVLWLTQPEDR